jgi:hypothetical protein
MNGRCSQYGHHTDLGHLGIIRNLGISIATKKL